MIWIIIIIIGTIVIYSIGKNSGETIGKVSSEGGMRSKYAELLFHVLDGHKDSKIITETRTYIKAGVSNHGGTTMFHIQQCPNDIVMIDYEISNNPMVPDFSLRFKFPDNMDQSKMLEQIALGIDRKINSLISSRI